VRSLSLSLSYVYYAQTHLPQRQLQQQNRYAVPSHLRKSYKPKTSDEAAVAIQSLYRSHRSRQEEISQFRVKEDVKEEEISKLNEEIVRSFVPKINALHDQIQGLETQLRERSEVAAKLGAEVKRLEIDEIPSRNVNIQHYEKIVDGAKRQLEIGSGGLSSQTEALNTMSLTTTEAKIDKAMSILSSACETMRLEDHKLKTKQSTLRERGWAGGGHGAPRMENNEGDSKRPCDVPYIFPNLEPPSIRKKRESEKMWNSISRETGLLGSTTSSLQQKTTFSTMRSSSSSSRMTKTKSRYRDGSDYLSPGLGLRKSDFVPKSKELQSTLPISTRGSAKQVIARVRETLATTSSTTSTAATTGTTK
jgi:hypothetical protein